MKHAFVIGHPIGHSRSPLIHGYWLERYGIAGSYEAIDIAPSGLPAFIDRLRAGEFVGGNVTIPHKEAVFALCDEVAPVARLIGAANTLTRRDGAVPQVRGDNTDCPGFLANLDDRADGWSAALGRVIVLGAGGAARAVLAALAQRRPREIRILNRTPERAIGLAAELGEPLGCALTGGGFDDFATLAADADLVVNTSAMGMHEPAPSALTLDALPSRALVTDIVYVPLETPLLAAAAARGLRTVDGLGMLLHQAVPGFEAWFGVRPEVTADLRERVEATLR